MTMRPSAAAGSFPYPHRTLAELSAAPPAAGAPPMTAFAAPLGKPPSVAMVAPQDLRVDLSYQRSLKSSSSTKLIGSIAEAWDWRLCVPLMVSDRDDAGLFVIDGQHRREAAVMRGDIAYLPCAVGRYHSVADEARLFVAANRWRRPISRVDVFRAAVAAGDEGPVIIDTLVREAGLSIAPHTNTRNLGPGELAFTSGLLSALKVHGREVVGAALADIGAAFPDENLVNAGALFAALAGLRAHPPEDFDPDRLFRALLEHDTAGWSQRARLDMISGGEQRAKSLRSAILGQYRATAAVAP